MKYNLELNAARFSGQKYIDIYQKYRPSPPPDLIYTALNYLNKTIAGTVVDLGCGTGISTRIWEDFAENIVGIEPSEEMIKVARKLSSPGKTEYLQRFSYKTGLASEIADIITCSQSFHWMEPKTTLAEVDRLMRPGGVLVVYDAHWPPTINEPLEKAYHDLFDRVDQLTGRLESKIMHKWEKSNHSENIKSSGYFSFCRKQFFHKSTVYDPEVLIGLALSQGGLEALLKRGYSDKEIEIPEFIQSVKKNSSLAYSQMTYQYSAIIAIK
ncbi:MAG: class I SAM-dependent methyltransferase [Saprospiraceae bacterium]|nr:class I SAM-dependent methyltransferase [Saprospiraceae bacterium]